MAEPPPRHQVLLLRPFPFISGYEEAFLSKFEPLKPSESTEPLHSFLITHAQSVKALICSAMKPLPAEILRCLPSLELVVTSSVGIDHIDLEECRSRGIAVANAGDSYSDDVADYAVGLLLDVLRRVSGGDRYVRGGLWAVKGKYPLGSKVGARRVGIVGLGSIGSEIAKRLESFGCHISYNSKKRKPSVPYPYFSSVHELAIDSDVLIVCCTLTEETYHLITRDVLLALGKNGILINVGRGAHVDEKELVQCLVRGEIGGVGLDVMEDEPNVPKELYELDNVVLSPHKAVFTNESFSNVHEHILGMLEAYFSKKPLLSSVI